MYTERGRSDLGGAKTHQPPRAQTMSVDRRDFLRLMTSAAALVATGTEIAEGEDRPAALPDRRVDVVVVGAGKPDIHELDRGKPDIHGKPDIESQTSTNSTVRKARKPDIHELDRESNRPAHTLSEL